MRTNGVQVKIYGPQWEEVMGGAADCRIGSCMVCKVIKYHESGQTKDGEMGGACGTFGGGFWCEEI
jgi:hypothetical protein